MLNDVAISSKKMGLNHLNYLQLLQLDLHIYPLSLVLLILNSKNI